MSLAFSVAVQMPAKIKRGRNSFIFQVLIFAQFITSSFCIRDHEVEDYKKVIFFHEILHRVEEPLQYAIWKQRGDQLQSNKNFYKEFNEPMEFFQQQYKYGKLLKSTEFFGALVKSNFKEALGLFHFLYQPYDWETFVQNACWARQHVNAHMYVYALTLAAVQRQIEHALMLPKIYEILPRYFLERRFVESVKQFNTSNIDTLSRVMGHNAWQWWLTIEPYDLSWRSYNLSNVQPHVEDMPAENLQAWWRPVDYTRDFHIMNEHAKLTYFTEDVDWNAYWYYLNALYPFFIKGKNLFWRNETRRGEFWLYSLQQMMTRYELERLSLGFVETPAFNWNEIIEFGYDPQLEEFSGGAFNARENNFEAEINVHNFDILAESRYTLERIEDTIENGYFMLKNGSQLHLKEPQFIETISNLLQSNVDALDSYFDSHWYLLAMLYLAGAADHKNFRVQPNVLLNFETMPRDPLFYIFHKRIVNNFQHFREKLPSYTKTELDAPGLQIMSAHISELVTYFYLYDLDASNLPTQTANNVLFARQMRLTHRPFHFNLTIAAESATTAMLRIFLGPTHDSRGHAIPLKGNRKNFLELHKILIHLEAGENHKIFNYDKYFKPKSKKGNTFLGEMYFDALDPVKRTRLFESYDTTKYCGLNVRLLLPRGSVMGLPMQLFFMLNDMEGIEENQHHWWKVCSPLQGKRAYGFPFDRPIVDEDNFRNTNMYWKTVKIYHSEESFG